MFFVCLEFRIILFVISTFMSIFFIEISFALPPPPQLPKFKSYLKYCHNYGTARAALDQYLGNKKFKDAVDVGGGGGIKYFEDGFGLGKVSTEL